MRGGRGGGVLTSLKLCENLSKCEVLVGEVGLTGVGLLLLLRCSLKYTSEEGAGGLERRGLRRVGTVGRTGEEAGEWEEEGGVSYYHGN